MEVANSWLGDVELAREIAQEAFLDAYSHIQQLRDPAKHCDRVTRRQRLDDESADLDLFEHHFHCMPVSPVNLISAKSLSVSADISPGLP